MTTPDTLPDDVAALRALVLTAWAERDAERAEKGRLVEERDQLALSRVVPMLRDALTTSLCIGARVIVVG